MSACTRCGDPTDRLCGVCVPCIVARTEAERTAQGLPLDPSDETLERLARALGPKRVAA